MKSNGEALFSVEGRLVFTSDIIFLRIKEKMEDNWP